MKDILRFAAILFVGVLFILAVCSIYTGTVNVGAWPSKVRETAATLACLWAFFAVLSSSD